MKEAGFGMLNFLRRRVMQALIIAVLALLVLTRLYKSDQVSSVRHFRLAWACLIASVAIMAAGQLLMIMASDEKEMALLTGAAIPAALAVSLYLWHKAVTAAG
jgi:hypothetical protein